MKSTCNKALLASLVLSVCLTAAGYAQTGPALTPLRAAAAPTHDETWWKHAVLYEIYPRSFQDSNGDGVGDLNGITQRLPYLEQLGVDGIWIAPMFPSPQVDFGYDVSDYMAVDPQYGTLADFDRLVAAARQRKIRVVLDMVLNHTSDKHDWFVAAASSRSNPKHDWYCWSDGKPAPAGTAPDAPNAHMGPHGLVMPPNNWISLFGGPAWEWVPAVQQFYYHKFYKQQPDLNWRNPQVEQAMFAAMRFWLDRGVAGFRLDAITTLFEDPQLRDEPVYAPGTNAQGDPNLSDIHTNMLPEVHDVLQRMRAMVDSYAPTGFPGGRVLVGETYLPNTAELNKWYGNAAKPELQLPMDLLPAFHSEGGATGANVALDLAHLRRTLTEMQTELGSNWPLLVFDNHDNPRSWDRFADHVHDTPATRASIAKILATTLLTTRAAALMYYGEELGMATHTPTRKEDVQDPIGITGWPKEKGRDGERTPMQWTPGTEGGFTTSLHPWLPLPPETTTINVASETADAHSLLKWYERLIAMRRELPALHDGGTVMLDTANPSVLSWLRTAPAGARPILVSLNMTAVPQTIHLDLSGAVPHAAKVQTLLTDEPSLETNTSFAEITLPPYASYVGEIQ